MSEDTREQGNRSSRDAALSARLRRLGERLGHTPTQPAAEPQPVRADASALARGLRLSSELVAGVVVGALIGWALDHWLGISPWGLIVFVLLGFAAGVLNVLRSAGLAQRP